MPAAQRLTRAQPLRSSNQTFGEPWRSFRPGELWILPEGPPAPECAPPLPARAASAGRIPRRWPGASGKHTPARPRQSTAQSTAQLKKNDSLYPPGRSLLPAPRGATQIPLQECAMGIETYRTPHSFVSTSDYSQTRIVTLAPNRPPSAEGHGARNSCQQDPERGLGDAGYSLFLFCSDKEFSGRRRCY